MDDIAHSLRRKLLLSRRVCRQSFLSQFTDPRVPIRTTVSALNRIHPMRYTDADPCALIEIDPTAVRYICGPVTDALYGRVKGGGWDQGLDLFTEQTTYQSVKNRFVHGYDWNETEVFVQTMEKVKNGEPVGNYRTESDVLSRFEQLDKTYESIKNEGYLTQKELLAQNPTTVHKTNNDASHPLLNEIGVCIGRDGTFIFRSRGGHRLAIARILELDTVPVQVFTRHRQWQQQRYAIQRSGTAGLAPEISPAHPDLADTQHNGSGQNE